MKVRKMFVIVMVSVSFPACVGIFSEEGGRYKTFSTPEKAEEFASRNLTNTFSTYKVLEV